MLKRSNKFVERTYFHVINQIAIYITCLVKARNIMSGCWAGEKRGTTTDGEDEFESGGRCHVTGRGRPASSLECRCRRPTVLLEASILRAGHSLQQQLSSRACSAPDAAALPSPPQGDSTCSLGLCWIR